MKNLFRNRLLTIGPAALLLGSLASAQTEVLVATGDVLPGLGVVDEVFEVAIDDADNWVATVHTDTLLPNEMVLIRNGAVVLKPGDPLPGYVAGYTFLAARSLGPIANGDFGWLAGHFASPLSPAPGAYVNQSPLAVIGDLVAAPGITLGTMYNGFYDQVLEESGSLIVHAYMNDPAITGLLDNVILRLVPQLGGGVVATDLYKRGDSLPGSSSPIREFSETSSGMATNASGQLLFLPTFQSGVSAVYLDQTPLALSGQQSPIFGRLFSSFLRMPVALNDAGDYLFGCRITGDIASDQLLVWNGIKLIQKGDTLPTFAPFKITDFGIANPAPSPLRLSDTGQALWYAAWDDPDTTRNSGLFLDHELLLQEGETWIDGSTIDDFRESTLFAARPVFDMNSDATSIVFRARLTDGRTGAFRVHPAGGVTTLAGCVPNAGALTTSGPPTPGAGVVMTLSNAQAEGASGFVFASSQLTPGFPPCGLALPGVGEVLVSLAAPDLLLVAPGFFPALGGVTFLYLGNLPNDPQLFGLTLYAQGLWLDTLGTVPSEPVRLTNALSLSIGQ